MKIATVLTFAAIAASHVAAETQSTGSAARGETPTTTEYTSIELTPSTKCPPLPVHGDAYNGEPDDDRFAYDGEPDDNRIAYDGEPDDNRDSFDWSPHDCGPDDRCADNPNAVCY
ncbi:hypothetical protein SPRG_14015 [Saprolegnia parasitica CBS 223.65]|uniref:Uncharacterized protein n=1 Tax=Saprolegnia parasitica (strain CBS 223.65) TaxID=695850 RepID=A0A067C0Z3_SAPPC|nr:hypothetical protein SPRG_14015 [Saprolegnia parasitica CBS 223.65]KDO20497.1 hypothetical protein SPRG_14015 [Saprolegnia parasitica CBS 223.65]|eukprot:XP_012208822.1 hypothetical protein SPRG_14015 [Saprolegnia parasitica CBS 223.65]